MKDLISREALALDVRRNLMPNVDADGTVSVEDAERYFLSRIEKAPAVDAAEVVRCSKCKYGVIDDPDFPNQYFCRSDGDRWNSGEYFCSDGEPRMDGE